MKKVRDRLARWRAAPSDRPPASLETPDQIFDRAKALLAEAKAAGREPFGWVTHPALYQRLLAARRQDADPQIKYRYLMSHRLFFSDDLPDGTLRLIYAEPPEGDAESS